MNESIEKLLKDCTRLALELAYDQESNDDLVWLFADGLYQKDIHDKISGKCSLEDMLKFDLSEVEQELREIRATFWLMLKPDKLDFAKNKNNFSTWQTLIKDTFNFDWQKSWMVTFNRLQGSKNDIKVFP